MSDVVVTKRGTLLSLAQEFAGETWAIEPSYLQILVGAFVSMARGDREGARESLSVFAADDDDADGSEAAEMQIVGSTAVIPIDGILMKSKTRVARMRKWGIRATSYLEIRDNVRAALGSPDVDSIVLDVSSPGGLVPGCNDLSAELHAANQKKPIVSFTDELNASAAYFLSSQASAMFASSDAKVGSIGTYMAIDDCSGLFEAEGIKTHVVRSGPHKGVGVIGSKITEEHLAALQENVDDLAKQFFAAVKRGRGDKISDLDSVTNGDIWVAGRAKSKGIIDGIKTPEKSMSFARSLVVDAEAEAEESTQESSRVDGWSDDEQVPMVSVQREEAMAEHDEKTPTPLTVARLQSEHAAIYEEVFAAGQKAERERVAFIREKGAGRVSEELMQKAITENWDTTKTLSEFLDYSHERKEARLAALRSEHGGEEASVGTDDPEPEATEFTEGKGKGENAEAKKIEAMPEGEAKWKAEFAASAELQEEFFNDEASYIAYRKNPTSRRQRRKTG